MYKGYKQDIKNKRQKIPETFLTSFTILKIEIKMQYHFLLKKKKLIWK